MRFGTRAKKIWSSNNSKSIRKSRKKVSVKRVQRFMKELQIRSIGVKKFHYYSENITSNKKENLLNQDFTTTLIYKKCSTHITCIHTKKDVWTYLVSVMEVYSKKIIGYSYLNVKDTKGILLHGDLGANIQAMYLNLV